MLDLSRLNALTENITAQEQFDLTEIVSQVLVSLEGKITGRTWMWTFKCRTSP